MAATNGHSNGRGQRYTQADWTDFAHTGPEALAGRYMRTFWHPVRLSRDLELGQAAPIRVMGEDFTLFRGESGKPYLIDFRCAHRGTQLNTGWVEGDHLRCLFHGWMYDGHGQCVEQPAEHPDFCSRVQIPSYATEEYLGMIFAYLGEGEPPPLPHYSSFEDEGILTNSTYIRDCNFFQNVENFLDGVHVAFTHRDSHFAEHGMTPVPVMSGAESDWGVTAFAQREGDRVRATLVGIPNIGVVPSAAPPDPEKGWSESMSWRVPIDDESHYSFTVNINHIRGEAKERLLQQNAGRGRPGGLNEVRAVGEQLLRGEVRWRDVEGRPDIVGLQDHASQVGQGRIANRSRDRLAQSDVAIIIFRKLWSEELRALAEGRPLRHWERTERVKALHGGI